MDRYCVIGFPVSHSLSPRLHNRAFRKFGIPAMYESREVSPKNLASFMKTFRTRYAGANVTIPHKEKVMKFLDSVSSEARAIGAVNTIVNRGGKLAGYNTDVYGAMLALRTGKWLFENKKLDLKKQNGAWLLSEKVANQKFHLGSRNRKWLSGSRAIVLGAGGAARAIVYGLKKAGAKVVILNRTLSHAKKLAKEFGCEFGRLEDFKKFASRGIDIVINATSVGMIRKAKSQKSNTLQQIKKIKGAGKKSKVSAISPSDFHRVLDSAQKKPIILDIVYRPLMTKFLRDAKAAGCRIITGDKMFLAQAEKSFELWTGTRPKFVKL